jgi:hypothetical protein
VTSVLKFDKFVVTWIGLSTILTYSMEQSPSWEANRFAARQEIPRILRNPKVHYRIQKCPLLDCILSHIDPVHALISYFLKTHLNIILTSTLGSHPWSLSLRFAHQNLVHASSLPIRTLYMPRQSHWSFNQKFKISKKNYPKVCNHYNSEVIYNLLPLPAK